MKFQKNLATRFVVCLMTVVITMMAGQFVFGQVPEPDKSITVIYPNGGEVWVIGSKYEVYITHNIDSLTNYRESIMLVRDNQEVYNIYTSPEGGYLPTFVSWVVPISIVPNDSYKVRARIYDYDKGEVIVTDDSDAYFSIVMPPQSSLAISVAPDTPPSQNFKPGETGVGTKLKFSVSGAPLENLQTVTLSYKGTATDNDFVDISFWFLWPTGNVCVGSGKFENGRLILDLSEFQTLPLSPGDYYFEIRFGLASFVSPAPGVSFALGVVDVYAPGVLVVMPVGGAFGNEMKIIAEPPTDYSAQIEFEYETYAVAVGDTLVVNAIVKNTCVYPLPKMQIVLLLIGADRSLKIFQRPILLSLQPEKIWAGTIAEIPISEEMGKVENYWLIASLKIPAESKNLDIAMAELWVFNIPEPSEPPEPELK